MLKRILVSFVLIPLTLLAIIKGEVYFFSMSLILSTLCLWEFYTIFESKNYYSLKTISILVSLLFLTTAYIHGPQYMIYFFVFIPIIISIEIFRKEKRSIINPVLSVFGLIYITIPFYMMNALEKDFRVVLFMVVLVWVCDSFAYFIGRFLGKRKLTEISPKKTVEGAVGGFIFTLVASLIYHYIQTDFITLKDALVCGILIGTVGQIGDLFESMLKRYTEVKDSSRIIPGHGGVLDRLDSLIFVLPILYIYFSFIR